MSQREARRPGAGALGAGTHWWRRGAAYLLLLAAAALYLLPIVFMVVGSLKPDAKVLPEAGS